VVLIQPEVTNDPTHAPKRLAAGAVADLPGWIAFPEGDPLKLATPIAKSVHAAGADLAFLAARVAEDNKARDIAILDMRKITPLYDYFVLITGQSRRQIHTIVEEVDAAMRAEGERRLGIEGYEASKWVIQDYGDVVVHVMDPDSRRYYALEELWADAPRVDWQRG
jgi:ribosome-associated protein